MSPMSPKRAASVLPPLMQAHIMESRYNGAAGGRRGWRIGRDDIIKYAAAMLIDTRVGGSKKVPVLELRQKMHAMLAPGSTTVGVHNGCFYPDKAAKRPKKAAGTKSAGGAPKV